MVSIVQVILTLGVIIIYEIIIEKCYTLLCKEAKYKNYTLS